MSQSGLHCSLCNRSGTGAAHGVQKTRRHHGRRLQRRGPNQEAGMGQLLPLILSNLVNIGANHTLTKLQIKHKMRA